MCSAHSKNKQRPKTLHAATLQLYTTAQLRHAPHNCSKEESNLWSQICCLLHPLLQHFSRVLCFAHITLMSMASVYYSPGLMLHVRNMKTGEESSSLGICVLLNINICKTDRQTENREHECACMQENGGRKRETESESVAVIQQRVSPTLKQRLHRFLDSGQKAKKAFFSPMQKHVECLDNSRQIRSFVHTVCLLKTQAFMFD